MITKKMKEMKILIAVYLLCLTGCNKDADWTGKDDPVIPVILADIESVNVNN